MENKECLLTEEWVEGKPPASKAVLMLNSLP